MNLQCFEYNKDLLWGLAKSDIYSPRIFIVTNPLRMATSGGAYYDTRNCRRMPIIIPRPIGCGPISDQGDTLWLSALSLTHLNTINDSSLTRNTRGNVHFIVL